MKKCFVRILKTFGFMLANLLLVLPLQAADDSRLVIVLDAPTLLQWTNGLAPYGPFAGKRLHCVADSGGGRFTLIQDVGQFAGQLIPVAPAPQSTPGTLILSAGATNSTDKLPASFLIYTANGDHVASFTARSEVSQPLPPGDYRVKLLWRSTRLEQAITIPAGQTITQHFDLGPMGKLRLSAQNAQQQAVDANFTLYSPTGDYLGGHLLKSVLNETLAVGNYRIKASLGDESLETQLDVTADSETSHIFQFRQAQ